MTRAVEFATILDPGRVDQALGLASAVGRFEEHDLGSILDHLTTRGEPGDLGPRRRNVLPATRHRLLGKVRPRTATPTPVNGVVLDVDEAADLAQLLDLMEEALHDRVEVGDRHLFSAVTAK